MHLLGIGRVWVTTSTRRRPEQMALVFADEQKTTFIGSADRALVAGIYNRLYLRVVKHEKSTRTFFQGVADFMVMGLFWNNQFNAVMLGSFGFVMVLGVVIWGAADRLILCTIALSGVICSSYYFAPAQVLSTYAFWIMGTFPRAVRRLWRMCSSCKHVAPATEPAPSLPLPPAHMGSAKGLHHLITSAPADSSVRPRPAARGEAAVVPKSGLWRGHTCGVYNGQDVTLTASGTGWRVEYLRERWGFGWLARCGFARYGRGDASHLTLHGSLRDADGPTKMQLGGAPCTLVDAITITFPPSLMYGVDVSWRWHESAEAIGVVTAGASNQTEPVRLISARELAGLHVSVIWPIPIPFISFTVAISEDEFKCLNPIWPVSRRYRRQPGTNTFFWHVRDVQMGFEDWRHFYTSRRGITAPGGPPLPSEPGDRAQGMTLTLRLF